MLQSRDYCGYRPGHASHCRGLKALESRRLARAARRAEGTLNTPEARARWRLTYRLKRYGLTQETFDRLLEMQDHACAMCHELFEDNQTICVDHDHACCPDEKRSCGACVRGLLCLRCNIALGYIEGMLDLAQAYLADPPARRGELAA